MITNSGAKLSTSPSFGTLAFQNGLEHHSTDWHVNSSDDPAT